MIESNKIALIDMDGTLADYDKGIRQGLDKLRSPEEEIYEDIYNSPSWIKARCDLIKKQPEFWSNLEKIELGFRVLDVLKDLEYKLMVLTKGPVRTTSAWTEKRDWCHKHLPGVPVTITEDKGLVYGKVLFDDFPPYIEKWLEWRPRGKVLMLDYDYNRNFQHTNVLRIKEYTSNDVIKEFLLGTSFEDVTFKLKTSREYGIVQKLLVKHPVQAEQLRAGTSSLTGFFVGLVMKETNGEADPKMVSDILAVEIETQAIPLSV